jgi:hypothetical protein
VTLTNTGSGTAFGAAISDPLPVVSGVSYSLGSSSPAGANCAITAGTLNCGPTDLTAGQSITAVVNATTTGAPCGSFTNTATGSATGLSNVTASASVTISGCGSALIAPTQTTCSQFASGTAPSEPFLSAGLKGSTINNVSPGVVFYYASLTVPATNTSVSVVQSLLRNNGTTNFPLIGVASGQAFVYTSGCVKVATFDLSNPFLPTTTLNAGSYIVQIKYSPNSITGSTIASVGTAFPVHYFWGISLNGSSTLVGEASIFMNKK